MYNFCAFWLFKTKGEKKKDGESSIVMNIRLSLIKDISLVFILRTASDIREKIASNSL